MNAADIELIAGYCEKLLSSKDGAQAGIPLEEGVDAVNVKRFLFKHAGTLYECRVNVKAVHRPAVLIKPPGWFSKKAVESAAILDCGCPQCVLVEQLRLIRQVSADLLGTCQSADTVIQEVFGDDSLTLTDLPLAVLAELDEITQKCDTCDWWVDADELNESNECDDCAMESGDD